MVATIDMINKLSNVDTKTNNATKKSSTDTSGKSAFKSSFEDELNKFNKPEEKISSKANNDNRTSTMNKSIKTDNSKSKNVKDTKDLDTTNVKENNNVDLEAGEDCKEKDINKELIELLQSLLNNSKLNNEKPIKAEDVNKLNEMIEELTKGNSIDLSKLKEILISNKLIPSNVEENNLVGKGFNSQLQDLLNLMKENKDGTLIDDKVKELIEKVLNKVDTVSKTSKVEDLGFHKKNLEQLKDMLKTNTDNMAKDLENTSDKNTSSTLNNELLGEDEKFLNGLLGEDSSYKNTKAMMFGTMNSEKSEEKAPTALSNIAIGDVKSFSLSEAQVTENISAPTMINKNTMAEDVVKNIKFMEIADLKELTVKINPKDLGEIVIRLSLENNEMKAKILAGNKETYGLLNSNLNEIKSNLLAQEFRVQEISVNIYFQDSTTYGEFKEGQGYEERNQRNSYNNGENSSENGEELLIDDAEDIYRDNNVNMLA